MGVVNPRRSGKKSENATRKTAIVEKKLTIFPTIFITLTMLRELTRYILPEFGLYGKELL